MKTPKHLRPSHRMHVLAAAVAVCGIAHAARADNAGTMETISLSGSTALKNFTAGATGYNGFTALEATGAYDNSLTLGNGTYVVPGTTVASWDMTSGNSNYASYLVTPTSFSLLGVGTVGTANTVSLSNGSPAAGYSFSNGYSLTGLTTVSNGLSFGVSLGAGNGGVATSKVSPLLQFDSVATATGPETMDVYTKTGNGALVLAGQINQGAAGTEQLNVIQLPNINSPTPLTIDIVPDSTRAVNGGTIQAGGTWQILPYDNGQAGQGPFAITVAGGAGSNNPLVATSLQLAPSTAAVSPLTPYSSGSATGLQVQWHAQGSVEGIEELVSDQLGESINTLVPRNPNSNNQIYVNRNVATGYTGQSGALGGATGYTLSAWGGTGQAGFPNPGNNYAGQAPVQMAISDVKPIQGFATSGTTSTPGVFNTTPGESGYGMGNPALNNLDHTTGTPSNIGTAGGTQQLQPASILNIAATQNISVNGALVQAGTGPWNSGGVNNLDTQTVAITATVFTANPGTGLTGINQTNAQWLETTGRLANGAAFNFTTRDVNSGTRNTSALNCGVDPSWAVGVNDNGNGDATTTINDNGTQKSIVTDVNYGELAIGPNLRFSGKTSGGSQLAPTVQVNRMSVGTLGMSDAISSIGIGQSNANPLRALKYDPNAGDTLASNPGNYILPTATTITNGTYQIWQQEQYVTMKAPNSALAGTNDQADWAATSTAVNPTAAVVNGTVPAIGDYATQDVLQVRNNVLNSVSNFPPQATTLDPADSLLSTSFILPQMMKVVKSVDSATPATTVNPNLNQTLLTEYLATPSLANTVTAADPATITAGTAERYGYSGSSKSTLASGASIYITAMDSSNNVQVGANGTIGVATPRGNWLAGNFNQTGVRDYAAFQTAVYAAQDLYASNGNTPFDVTAAATTTAAAAAKLTVTTNLSTGLTGMKGQTGAAPGGTPAVSAGPSFGDLVVMGDFNGDGRFDGKDIYDFAVGASLSDSLATTSLTKDYTDPTAVLNKNGALAFAQSKTAVGDYLRTSGAAVLEAPAVPGGATPVGTDAVSGNATFTFDPTGVHTFDPLDVTHQGCVDFNSAVAADNTNGMSFTNLADQLAAVIPAPAFTKNANGDVYQLINLALVPQVDGQTTIQQSDVTAINNGLSIAGVANWYSANLQKTGQVAGATTASGETSDIIWSRPASGSVVNVYPQASFEISSGSVYVGTTTSGAVLDPFTDNNATDTPNYGRSVGITIDHTGKLAYVGKQSSQIGSLTITGNAQLDIGQSTVMVDYTTGSRQTQLSNIQQYVSSGYDNGKWDGPGIISSNAPGNYRVGYIDQGNGQIKMMYTLAGDCTCQGTVNYNDLVILAQHYDTTGNTWADGDFFYTGTVGFPDLVAMAQNYGQEIPALSLQEQQEVGANFAADWSRALADVSPADGVPEPASLSLLALGAVGLLARRRKQS